MGQGRRAVPHKAVAHATPESPAALSVREPLRVEVVTDLAALTDLAPRWQQLVWASDEATAFATPAATLTWYRLVLGHSRIYALTVWNEDELVGLAPFSVLSLGPFRLLTTAGAGYGYDGAPLLGADPEPVAHAIIDQLRQLITTGAVAAYLRRLPIEGTLLKALDSRTDLACTPMGADEPRSVVRFDRMTDPDQYFTQVARKHAVPRRSRRLAERFDHVEYVVRDSEPGLALDTMRDMLRRRFDGDLRIFRTPQNRTLTGALVQELIAAGHARISSMIADGQRITVTVDLHVGDRRFWWAVAYDPELAKYSLGHLELYEFLRNAHASGATEVDLGSAGFAYKQRWANTIRHHRTVAVTALGARGSIVNAVRRAAIRSHRTRRIRADAGPPVV